MHLIKLDGVVYRVSLRTLHAIEHAGPEAGRCILVEKGYRVGTPVDFSTLSFRPSRAAQAEPSAQNLKGRPPGTGRFGTREELLDRAWFYKNCTDMSEAAIARNLEVSAGTLARIYRTGEGRPAQEEAAHESHS